MYQRILVPIDGSGASRASLDQAMRLAKLTGANLRLIHVVEDLNLAEGLTDFVDFSGDTIKEMEHSGEQILENARQRVAAAGVRVDILLSEIFDERVADVIVQQAVAWNADLIVIGTHGRRGLSRLPLGSDAEQILRLAAVPVLLVREDK